MRDLGFIYCLESFTYFESIDIQKFDNIEKFVLRKRLS